MIKGVFKFQKNTYKLIAAMVVISVIAIIVAVIYYGNINRSEDPRTVHIKKMYKEYTEFVRKNDYGNALEILDTMEREYKKIDHYSESFEIGVILTNKAATYLTLALYNSPDELEKNSNFKIAEKLLNNSLQFYKKWSEKYKNLTKVEILSIIDREFQNITKNRDSIIKKRLKELELATSEIDRRKSVAYTNLGIIKRHQKQFEDAIELYKNAIELWPGNLTAENNLRVLLGRDPKKRNFLQKMFPKSRK